MQFEPIKAQCMTISRDQPQQQLPAQSLVIYRSLMTSSSSCSVVFSMIKFHTMLTCDKCHYKPIPASAYCARRSKFLLKAAFMSALTNSDTWFLHFSLHLDSRGLDRITVCKPDMPSNSRSNSPLQLLTYFAYLEHFAAVSLLPCSMSE